MGVEVMRMAMKAGLTIRVSAPLRALFREVSGAVEVQALVSRQSLDKAERWGWDVRPTHLSFTTGTSPTLAFGEDGAVHPSPDDTLLAQFTIRGLALEVVRHFLEEMEGKRITLHFGPSSLSIMNRYLGDGSYEEELELSIVAPDSHGGYDKVKVLEDGGVSVKVSWGEPSWWDGWVVSPEGAVEYVGTVDGPRYRPIWLERALEKAKAKGP